MLVAQFFNGNFENVLLCVLTLVLFTLPSLFERRLHIDLPDTLEIIILLFIYAAPTARRWSWRSRRRSPP